jgi:hypothetical protein
MNIPVTVIQTFSALLIFVAGYLILLVSIICALVLASCVYKGGRLLRAYTVRPACRLLAQGGLRQRSIAQR